MDHKKRLGINSIIFGSIILITAGFSLAALHTSKGYFYSASPVGKSYFGQSPSLLLLEQTSSKILLLEMFAYCILTVTLGYHVLINFSHRSHCVFGRGFMLVSGFIPGYLILIAVNRVVTFVLPNGKALDALYGIYLCVVLYEFSNWYKIYYSKNGWKGDGALVAERPVKMALVALIAVAVVFLFLIYQVQIGNVHVIGDSARFFLDIIQSKEGFGTFAHFPIVTQHYDEIMFLYPVLQSNINAVSMDMGNAINDYWVLYAFGKAACFSIVVIAVYSLSNSKLLGILIAALLFLGSIHPYPLGNHLLFDSGNPLGFNLHIGRVVLSVLPIAVFAIVHNRSRILVTTNKANTITLVFMGLGLTSLSIHFTIIIISSVAMMLLLLSPIGVQMGAFIISLAMLSVTALYGPATTYYFGMFSLALCVLMILFHAISLIPTVLSIRHSAVIRKNCFLIAVFLLSILCGMLLLGNMMVMKTYPLGFHAPESLTRFSVTLFMKFGRNPFCGIWLMMHCASLANFINYYGLPFILMGITALCEFWYHEKQHGTRPCDETSAMFAMLAFACVMLLLSLFFYDFMDGDKQGQWMGVWLKSRLPEPWFYCCIALSLVVLWNRSAICGKRIILTVILFFILVQNIMSKDGAILKQLVDNFYYVIEHIAQY